MRILNLTTPTAQQRYTDFFSEHSLEWREIYSLPFKVVLDTKSREFQYKILHRFLTTNILLKKMGKVDSIECSFCGTMDESLEHLFVSCPIITTLWNDFICWCRGINIQIDSLCVLDLLFGLWNHVIIIAKQYIYYFRNNVLNPPFSVLLLKIDSIYDFESRIASLNNKLSIHSLKWGKYVEGQ